MTKKIPYAIYDPEANFEAAEGVLRIFIPSGKGFINYNLVRSLRKEQFADIWRLGLTFFFDEDLKNERELTRVGAEWDMATLLEGRDDFIGGFNHGDEAFYSFSLKIDGKYTEPYALKSLTPFKEIFITAESLGYDPCDHKTKVLLHKKEYRINEGGVRLEQRVEWLGDYTVGSSYLAMMPPLKKLTDTYYTDISSEEKEILIGIQEKGVRSATVLGKESGFSFRMSIPEYPRLESGGIFMITDNGGSPYNKMYYFACKKASVRTGEVWKSTTFYEITAK